MKTEPFLLGKFKQISLAEMDSVKLLNRIDSKYIIPINSLTDLLLQLSLYYDVLEVEGNRIHHYQTLYFDTHSHRLYKEHHSGKINRMKIRYRQYVDTGLNYFEVKKKNGKNRTVKYRESRSQLSETLCESDYQLIDKVGSYQNELFWPQLWVYFDRITLVRKDLNERVTIDINIEFERYGQQQKMTGLSVVEIKQDKSSVRSPIIDLMKQRHIIPERFSKYAIGTALLTSIKFNRFKPIFIRLNKIAVHVT